MSRIPLCMLLIAWPAALSAAPAPAGGSAPTSPFLSVRFAPIERMLDDVKHVTKKLGHPEAAAKFEDSLKKQFDIDSFAGTGIDLTKPLGFYAVLKQELQESLAVCMIPVADEKKFLKMLEAFRCKYEAIEDGLYSVTVPEVPVPVFLRFAEKYAYVTALNKTAIAVGQIVTPAKMFAGDEKSLVMLTLRPDQIPDALRKEGLVQMKSWIEERLKELDDDESELITALNGAQWKPILEGSEQFVNDGKDFVARIEFDRASGELSFNSVVTAKSGSKLAENIAAIVVPKSIVGTLAHKDAAANIQYCVKLVDKQSELLSKAIKDNLDEIIDTMDLASDDEKAEKAAKDLITELLPTVEAGLLDFTISLRGPSQKKYAVVAGMRIKNGKKVEAAVRKLSEFMPDDKKKLLKWDFAKAGSYSVGRFEDTDDEEEWSKKIFGEKTPLYFSFRDDAVVIAFGEGGEAAIKADVQSLQESPAPGGFIDVAVSRLKDFAEAISEGGFTHVQKTFGETADRVRIFAWSMEGGPQLKTKYAMSLQTFVGIGMHVNAMVEEMLAPFNPPPAPPAPPQGGNPPPLN